MHKPWKVLFNKVTYDTGSGKMHSTTKYYRTKNGARFSMWVAHKYRHWDGAMVLQPNSRLKL